MTFDGRIDRATLTDDENMPSLILDRLVWNGGDEEALARPYESFFHDLMGDALKRIRIPVELEDWAELAQQEVVEAYDDRYYALEEEHGSPLAFAVRFAHEHPEEFFLSAPEIAADDDDFMERLVARVGPRPVAEDDATADLPPLLRRLYREIGASGWGPAGGFRAPAEVVEARRWAQERIRGPGPEDVWPDTLLPVVDGYVVDASTPALEVAPFDPDREPMWGLDGPMLFGPQGAATLRGWLERWLRGLYPFAS